MSYFVFVFQTGWRSELWRRGRPADLVGGCPQYHRDSRSDRVSVLQHTVTSTVQVLLTGCIGRLLSLTCSCTTLLRWRLGPMLRSFARGISVECTTVRRKAWRSLEKPSAVCALEAFNVFINFSHRSMRTFRCFHFSKLFFTISFLLLPWWSNDLELENFVENLLHLAMDQHPVCPNTARRELFITWEIRTICSAVENLESWEWIELKRIELFITWEIRTIYLAVQKLEGWEWIELERIELRVVR